MSDLRGKVALVTGASKGMGASIAEHRAGAGAAVVVNYAASKAGADAVVKRIADKKGQATAVQADVSNTGASIGGKCGILLRYSGILEGLAGESACPTNTGALHLE